ncbi:ankyrin repeat domain-containing protein [Pseudofrankia inefficax]|uniref:Ankyrin n=1 Tax=Pseudofrankia inefficax (strain DSM 45817 / CECT 9037 / DDB 130130 / EuI1c) TaxID=298654 RepID=E3J0D1_PSEI1|nr:ankyrin repeat domain-containing protein [Pseudofrankia inefficax]ADP81560.1 Ankyrin [Pseudofrankia inefficax]
MTQEPTGRLIPGDDPAAVDLVLAVRGGDAATVSRLLADDPGLASVRIGARAGTRTALHVVTDWPGYFPSGPHIARLLLAAGADPNARTTGRGPGETPLHWAASSDDVDVAVALIDGGADLDAADGSIGTPLANAVGYGCWHVARLVVARGARVAEPWQAAALGILDRLDELLGDQPDPDEVSKAFWHACSGGQRRAADYLLARGADLQWVPPYAEGTPLDAAGGLDTQRENVVTWLREKGARPASSGA